ncbi:adhesin [Escherichia coli]|nr:adhesin [Escherichia coli]
MDLINPFIVQDAVQQAYNNDRTASGFGTGGKYQQAIQAATAAVQGLAGGNLSAPWQVVQRRILLK